MPFVKYDREGLTTMSEVARLCGMSVSWFFVLVKEQQIVEGPSKRVGERRYYTEEQIDRVVKQVADLRRSRRIG